MGKYTVRDLVNGESAEIEALSKGAVLKAWKAHIGGGLTLKALQTRLEVIKLKEPPKVKVERIRCAVCQSVVVRGEYVQHVRGEHGMAQGVM